MNNQYFLDGLMLLERNMQMAEHDTSGHYFAVAKLTVKSLINKLLIDKSSSMIRHSDALELAFEYIGLTEKVGLEHNPEIVSFFHEIGYSWVLDDETPWCAAFVGAILKKSGYKHSGKLNARSYLTVGEKVEVPELGDIVVFFRGDPAGAAGHVAFYLGESKNNIYCLGGNQSDQVRVSAYDKAHVLGFRRLSKA